jgi:PKD repeat protein
MWCSVCCLPCLRRRWWQHWADSPRPQAARRRPTGPPSPGRSKRSTATGTWACIPLWRWTRPAAHQLHWGESVALKYARFDGAAWQIETIDTYGEVWDTSIALDADNRPHISYLDSGYAALRYAYYDGAAWQIETVDSDGNTGYCASLALDTAGRPHISYNDFGNGDLKYAHFDGAAWQIETVDSVGDVGWDSSLALDAAGRPHISYRDNSSTALKYARYDGATWQIETVDNDGNVGYYTSLALDATGRPHISYYDHTNSALKYAWQGYVPPEAGFTGNPTSGSAPLTVVFTNTSTGGYEASLWVFGDGITSTLQHPTHVYQAPGSYTVTLQVSGPAGTGVLARPDYIQVYQPAEAEFTATPTSGVAPLTVVFTNSSTGDYDTSLWLFGDGMTSTLPSPTYIYPAAGSYTVTLTVSGPGGTDTEIKERYIIATYGIYLPVLLRAG